MLDLQKLETNLEQGVLTGEQLIGLLVSLNRRIAELELAYTESQRHNLTGVTEYYKTFLTSLQNLKSEVIRHYPELLL